MKVVYTDPHKKEGTYHPKLGYLRSGVPFDLPDGEAEKYVDAGLLTEVVEDHLVADKPGKAGLIPQRKKTPKAGAKKKTR